MGKSKHDEDLLPALVDAFLQHLEFSFLVLDTRIYSVKSSSLSASPTQFPSSSFSHRNEYSYSARNSTSLNLLLVQLSHEATPSSVSRARAILQKIQNEGKLDLLDSNSLGHLAIAAAKSGSPRYGESIIRLMLELGFSPHVKVWSAVVTHLGKSSQHSHLAFQLFHDMCNSVKGVGKRNQMRPDTGAFNAILNICAANGNMARAEDLIKEMGLFGVRPDVLTYNIMIKLYARVRREDLIAGVIEKMLGDNIEPCISTFCSLVAAYVGFGDLEKAEMLVQAMREDKRDICSILRQSNQATLQRNLLLPRSYRPDHRIYTILMKGYLHKGRLRDVIKMLRAMQDEDDPNSHPNEVTYTTAISAFVKMGSMDEAHAVLREMATTKMPANVITYNSLLNGYCRSQKLHKAKVLMQEMKDAGIVPDVVSYNTLINGFICINDNMGALACFDEMRNAGIDPSKITYTTLMKAFGINGQPVIAAKIFEEMQKDLKIKIDIVAWNMLIESYSKAGMMEHAKKVFQQMKEKGFHPTVATYGSLVNGFVRAQKPVEALALWPEIKERTREKCVGGGTESFVPDLGILDSLVEICVRAAFFKRALEILAYMDELKIPVSKRKYKSLFMKLHSNIYTSKHASRARQERRAAKREAAEAFKFWAGLRNDYHTS
ncbi:hypothetical protein SUGI_0058250 [Cryptomeria japonica]|nr:hypothetical protein SUGI_0058250 [Cryptomeria japonica]